ncbi:MAG: flagellar biosynthetic protein FliQ [Phycisphaerales bacterium]
MPDDAMLDLVKETLWVVLKVSLPVLAAGIVIGLIISIIQSVTQIQEQTLSLIPKMVVMTVVAIALTPWIYAQIADFTIEMFRF